MGKITELFLTVFNMSITAGFVVLLVILARQFLKKSPKMFSYMLWVLVAFRLLCPFSVSGLPGIFGMGIFSEQQAENGQMEWRMPDRLQGVKLVPAVQREPEKSEPEKSGAEKRSTEGTEPGHTAGLTGTQEEAVRPQVSEITGPDADFEGKGSLYLMDILCMVWLAGIAVFSIYQLHTWRKLKKEVATAVRSGENIYESDRIREPFVMGTVRPRIYLPFRMAEKERVYILKHEQYHIRRHDHQIKFLAVMLLALHWFNPLVWTAYRLMCRDMEMSCDEKVIALLGGEIKNDYSRSLLSFASERRVPAVSPLAFGETSVKTRIRNILHFQNPKKAAVGLGIVVCAAALVAGIGGEWNVNTIHGESTRTVNGGKMVRYGYHVSAKIKSYAIYKEFYLDGKLKEYGIVQSGSVGKDGIPRKGELDSGFDFMLRPSETSESGYTHCYLYRFAGQQDTKQNLTDMPNGGIDFSLYQEDTYQSEHKKIVADEGIVLAAFNIGGEQITSGHSCEEYMDPQRKSEIIRGKGTENRGVILYELVFSEKDVEELAAAYCALPYAQELSAARNPYIGNASADGTLLKLLRTGDLGSYQMELQTSEKPYGMKVRLEDMEPGTWYEQYDALYPELEARTVLFLSLTENADYVEWEFPTLTKGDDRNSLEVIPVKMTLDDIQQRWHLEEKLAALAEDADASGKISGEELYGTEELLDLKALAGTPEGVQDILKMIPARKERRVMEVKTQDGIRYWSPRGEMYQYKNILTGRFPNAAADSTCMVLSNAEDVTFEDVAEYFFGSRMPKKDMYAIPMEENVLAEALGGDQQAKRLFDARNPYVSDASADEKLLDILRVGDLGIYAMELETDKKPHIIRLHFKDRPEDEEAFENKMYPKAVMLLALIEDAEQVEWSYPSVDDDGSPILYTRYMDMKEMENLTRTEKMDLHELTETYEGVKKLMSYLGR